MSFPIEQSYINLAIVEAKEQRNKEKQLRDVQNVTTIIGAYEEIHGIKTKINIKDIFKTCKSDQKQVLVFGRAGIGKSTFCRYVAYQWAKGSYWSQYELLALIPLRRLTTDRYPPDKRYSLLDLVKKEVCRYDLSKKEKELLKKQFDPKKTLWVLDGYDEIVQNVPPHLRWLFEQLLNTPHHIVTSRPYLNTLSYDVQMEITGFTDINIVEYVERFFHQMKDELADASIKSKKLLRFLRSKPSVWGVGHIPVNLELICSLWSNEDCSDTEQLTITALYTMMTEWLCRRYLAAQGIAIQTTSISQVYQRCQKELTFLESLAFNAMESNTVLIRPALFEKALDDAEISVENHSRVLNIGFLKSVNKQGTGSQVETDKDHYFVHLSFQEYFAARYLIGALSTSRTKTAIDFIKQQKYNQRYTLVFTFVAGLMAQNDAKSCFDLFWNTLLSEPVDLVGIRHMQLVISCIEETTSKPSFPRRSKLLEWIASYIKNGVIIDSKNIREYFLESLKRAPSVACDQSIIDALIDLLEKDSAMSKVEVLTFISELKISNPTLKLVTSVTNRLDHSDPQVRYFACETLGKMGEKASTNEVITKLMSALADTSQLVRRGACAAFGEMGEKAATNEVITRLVSVLADENDGVTMYASAVLGKISEKAAANEVITQLLSALADERELVRRCVCEALGEMGEKAATNEVITKLANTLQDESEDVRMYACAVLGKMGEKAATSEVINGLLTALTDENNLVRAQARSALGKIGEKAVMNEVLNNLTTVLTDESQLVRAQTRTALDKISEKTAPHKLVANVVGTLADESTVVRANVCAVLGEMGDKAVMNEVQGGPKVTHQREN